MSTTRKPKKPSMIEYTRKCANDEDVCRKFFFDAVYPEGWICDKCGSHHYHPVSGRNNVWQCEDCGHQQYLFAGNAEL